MPITIDIQTPPPGYNSYPRVDFSQHSEKGENDFDKIIYVKGRQVIHERAIVCPCKTKGGDNLISCINCGSSGYVFYNPTQTRMLTQSMNNRKDFKDWSQEDSGTINITPLSDIFVSYMDRITIQDSYTFFSEVVHISNKIGKTVYPILDVVDCFLYKGSNEKLIALNQDQYSIINRKITITDNMLPTAISLSIRYKHNAVYHIIEMMRETMSTFVNKNSEVDTSQVMPSHCIARKAHYIMNPTSDASDVEKGILVQNNNPHNEFKIS